MTTVHLNNWSLHVSSDPYQAPEVWPNFLSGEVYNHPHYKDGHFVYTSAIESVDNTDKVVNTRNTSYALGEAKQEYLDYCEKIGSDPWRIFKEENKRWFIRPEDEAAIATFVALTEKDLEIERLREASDHWHDRLTQTQDELHAAREQIDALQQEWDEVECALSPVYRHTGESQPKRVAALQRNLDAARAEIEESVIDLPDPFDDPAPQGEGVDVDRP